MAGNEKLWPEPWELLLRLMGTMVSDTAVTHKQTVSCIYSSYTNTEAAVLSAILSNFTTGLTWQISTQPKSSIANQRVRVREDPHSYTIQDTSVFLSLHFGPMSTQKGTLWKKKSSECITMQSHASVLGWVTKVIIAYRLLTFWGLNIYQPLRSMFTECEYKVLTCK